MINQQILDYVKQQMQQGVSQEQIKNSLVANGWQASDVQEAFSVLSGGIGTIPTSTPSAPSASYAGFWLRVAASLIDAFIFGLVSGVLVFVYSLFSSANTEVLLNITYLIVWTLYFPFMESRGGATFGKKLVGIRVLNANGEALSFGRSLARSFSKFISATIFMIGFIMVGFTEKKQGLHDIIAGCVVVKGDNTSAGKVWAIIILILVICVGTLVMAGAKFLSVITGMLSDSNIQSTSTRQSDAMVIPMTTEEYDALFAEQITGLENEKDYKGPSTYAGPALITFDDFWGLNIAMPPITNLGSSRDYAWIELSSVTSKDGQEILNSESAFEKDMFFKKLNLQTKMQPFEFLYDHRQIHLVSGAKKSDIQTIKGTLFIKIPLDSKDSENFYEQSYPFTITN
jgi:uncharacterized RDD family membrane protein YckC